MIIIWPSISTLIKLISQNFFKIPTLSKAVFHLTIDQLQLGVSIPVPLSHTKLPQPVVPEGCNFFIFKEVSTRIGITWHFGN